MYQFITLLFISLMWISACAPLRQETVEGIADYPATTTIEDEVSGTKKQTYSSEAYSNFLEGYIYEQGGELDKALPKYEEALHHDQDSLFLLSRVATLQGKLGHINDAIETMNRLIVLAPRPSFALMLLAEMYFNIGDYEKSVESYDKLLEKEPKHIRAYFYKGMALSHLKEYDKAVQSIKKGIALNPEIHIGYFYLGDVYFYK